MVSLSDLDRAMMKAFQNMAFLLKESDMHRELIAALMKERDILREQNRILMDFSEKMKEPRK